MKALIAVLICLCIAAPASVGASYITSSSIQNGTIQASDLSPDLTHIQIVPFAMNPSDDNWKCTDPSDNSSCQQVVGSGAGQHEIVIRCRRGNAIGGGVKPNIPADGFNLDLYASYPSGDESWTFILNNSGPDVIKGQLRVVCL